MVAILYLPPCVIEACDTHIYHIYISVHWGVLHKSSVLILLVLNNPRLVNNNRKTLTIHSCMLYRVMTFFVINENRLFHIILMMQTLNNENCRKKRFWMRSRHDAFDRYGESIECPLYMGINCYVLMVFQGITVTPRYQQPLWHMVRFSTEWY